MPMLSTNQLQSLLAHWLPWQSPVIRVTSVCTGFSGGRVYRVELAADQSHPTTWALKAWPITAPFARITQIAEIVRAAAQNCDLLAPPLIRRDLRSNLVSELGFHWELARWIPGQPLAVDAHDEEVASGAEAIARVHVAMNQHEQTPATNSQTPRCISSRLERLRHLTPQVETLARRSGHPDTLSRMLVAQLTPESENDPVSQFRCRQLAGVIIEAAELLADCWARRTPTLLIRLAQYEQSSHVFPVQWTLRDVHREHVLFGSLGQVNGIIDYDAIDRDSPAADLARWAGDFNSLPAMSSPPTSERSATASLRAAVAGYRRIRPFSAGEHELAETLMDASALGSLGNWLEWLVLENRQFDASAERIRGRITHLIASICRIC